MICSWCILIYKKEIISWRFVQFTQSCDDITRSLLVLLVCMENIFKELLLFALSRGVPLDCGCKGRYFLQTHQTLLKLFYNYFYKKFAIHWFTDMAEKRQFQRREGNWHLHVAKHKKREKNGYMGREQGILIKRGINMRGYILYI